ncbi:MAG: BamA/TamA family outer membrane protein [Moraxellaceae bacterium]|nr:BamA/TamA family outer membrane protein [Moraxellaceae bacterium]MBS9779165.1 BamA/TamA family outer membrane protein [Moraxellaceae bacterium]
MNIRTPLPLVIVLLLLTNQASFANTDDDSEWQELLANVQLAEHIDNKQNLSTNQPIENSNPTKNETLTINKTDSILSKFAQKKLKAKIYILQKEKNSNKIKEIPANHKIEPFKNIKSALEDIYEDTLLDYQLALPRLKKTVKEACKAVGYYDVKVRFEPLEEKSTGSNKRMIIKVIIENLGKPAIVENRVVEIRGDGAKLTPLQKIEQNSPPLQGQIFNHGDYQKTKNLIENKSQQMGFFDGKWLNNSADVILPDNTVDIDLIYDTKKPYHFDEIVFFTLDEKTGKLTTDSNKLPVKKELLQQLFEFQQGDRYDAIKVNKLRNSLTATGYFNEIDVDEVLPNNSTDDKDEVSVETIPKTDENQDKAVDIALISFPNGLPADIDKLKIEGLNNQKFDGTANSILDNLINDSIDKITAKNDNEDTQLASLVFSVDDSTKDKYQAIENKANKLLAMPNDRLLVKEKEQAQSTLGKISDAISDVAKKILPEQEVVNNTRPTLTNKRTAEQVKKDKKIPLYVFVASNKPYDAQIGVGYGTDSGWRLTTKLENHLINRDGYQAGISAEWSESEKRLSAHVNRPWKHPLDDQLNVGLSYEEKVIEQGKKSDWRTQSVLASVGRNKYSEKGWNRHYALRYRYDNLNLGKDIQADNNKLPVQFNSANSTQKALLLGYSLNKTTVDNLANPTKGFKQAYSLELGSKSALSDTDIAILRAGASGIYSFGKNKQHQVIGKLNTGYLWAKDFKDVPYNLRFFAGGDQSIRGYDYNSLSPVSNGYLTGGQVLAVGSGEYSYEFKEGLRGAIFADVGNAYDKDLKTPTKLGVGFGIRWASPVGALRLDVGTGVTEKDLPIRLHLFIGSPL